MAWWDAGRRGAGLLLRSCRGNPCARPSGGLVVVSRFLKSAIQMNFAENQSWPARRLGRAAVWESPGGPTRETAPGGAQGELQGRQSQVGRGGSVLVLLLLAFDVCIHLVVWSVVRAGQAESHPDTHRSCADAFCRRSRDRSRAFISS